MDNKAPLICTIKLSAKLFIILLTAFIPNTHAQISIPGPILSCPGHPADVNQLVNMPSVFRANLQSIGNANSSIIVNYKGFSPQAQQAFQYAIDIWQSVLVSPIHIRIDASWEPLEANTLGSAGATTLYRDFREALRPNLWYPVALAERLTARELNPVTEPDIVALFNSNINWYYGLDGRTPPGQYNLVTVVLHEIAHGLGFFSSFDIENNQGLWGEETGYAFIYDFFLENGANQRLLNTAFFSNPSTQLASQLTSNNLFFDSSTPSDVSDIRTGLPRIYAPMEFNRGSSISHLDESRYPPGNDNALMTPQIARSESIYWPGEITLQIMTSLGWRTRTPGTEDTPIAVFPNPTRGILTIDGYFEENISRLSITVTDLLGKQLLSTNLVGSRRYFTEQFNMSRFPAGMYIVSVITDRSEFSRKVIVSR
jgi:hypothetical protein